MTNSTSTSKFSIKLSMKKLNRANASLDPFLLMDLRVALEGLFEYIETTKTVIGFSGEHLSSPVSILDAIDVNDGRDVSVKDVRDYLTSTAQAQQRSRSGAAPSASASQVRYSVEQCLSVTTQQWKKVMTTKFGHVTINALESGVPYRFRVIALNCNGLESKKVLRASCLRCLKHPVPRVAPLRGAAEVAGAALKLVWDHCGCFRQGALSAGAAQA